MPGPRHAVVFQHGYGDVELMHVFYVFLFFTLSASTTRHTSEYPELLWLRRSEHPLQLYSLIVTFEQEHFVSTTYKIFT